MCAVTGRPPAFECELGTLPPGTEFHTPNGERWMVLDLNAPDAESVVVVNIGNGSTNPFGAQDDELKGRTTPMYRDVKLGRDHRGRLYASSALNGWQYVGRTINPVPAVLSDGETIDAPAISSFPPDSVTGFDNRHED